MYILYLRICIFLYLCTSTSERSFQVNVSHKGPEIGTGCSGEATKGFLINPAAKPQKTTSSSIPKPKATKHFVNVFKTQIVVFNSLIIWNWLLCIVCFAIYRSSLVRIPGPVDSVVLGNLTRSSLTTPRVVAVYVVIDFVVYVFTLLPPAGFYCFWEVHQRGDAVKGGNRVTGACSRNKVDPSTNCLRKKYSGIKVKKLNHKNICCQRL